MPNSAYFSSQVCTIISLTPLKASVPEQMFTLLPGGGEDGKLDKLLKGIGMLREESEQDGNGVIVLFIHFWWQNAIVPICV
jgi:hypothetical protein